MHIAKKKEGDKANDVRLVEELKESAAAVLH